MLGEAGYRRIQRAVLTVSIVSLVTAAAADDALTGPQIRKLLVGNTATGALLPSQGGGRWFAYYGRDGNIDYLAPNLRAMPIRGARWLIAEDAWCVVWPRSGQICYHVVRRGEKYEFVSERRDSPGGPFEILPGDAKHISRSTGATGL
jgi:hypothetical protein